MRSRCSRSSRPRAATSDEARENADAARELGRRHGLRVVDECAAFALGALELAQGRPEVALEYLEPLADDVAAHAAAESRRWSCGRPT